VLRGERWSAARAYLEPVAARPNLTVLTGALVVSIRFEGLRAAGVDFITGGERRRARARREVILAAGAIGSPQILQLSGIGPGTFLRRLGIEVHRDLPGVGANLSDHPDIALQHRCRRAAGIYPYTRAPRRWLVGLQWLLTRRGPAAQNHVEAGAFLRSRGDIWRPDLQLTLVPLALKPGSFESIDGPGFQIHIDLMQPRSRGSVRLSSPDPAAAPAISFDFLAVPEDLAALVAGLRLTRELLACPAFDELRGEEIAPGPALRSAAEIEDWIRQTVEIGYHTAGSCKMGPAGDPRAVVGPDLRLPGIEGLRIADASIMPATVSGNTNAPVIMIAEKASDLIRGRDPLPAAELPGPRGLAPSPA
jgi:choline dehydrogenase